MTDEMTPERENELRLIGLLIGALREAGELSESQWASGEPEWIAAGLERLKTRAMAVGVPEPEVDEREEREMAEMETSTRDLGFHESGGYYFRRLDDGSVRIVHAHSFGDEPLDIEFAHNIDPSSWASVVASVSALGENGSTHRHALAFHNNLRVAELREFNS